MFATSDKKTVMLAYIMTFHFLNEFHLSSQSSGVSHSDGSCVLGRIHQCIIEYPEKSVSHSDGLLCQSLIHILSTTLLYIVVEGGGFIPLVSIYIGIVKYLRNFWFYIQYNLGTLHIPEVHFPMKLRSWYATMWYTPTWWYATMCYTQRSATGPLDWYRSQYCRLQ